MALLNLALLPISAALMVSASKEFARRSKSYNDMRSRLGEVLYDCFANGMEIRFARSRAREKERTDVLSRMEDATRFRAHLVIVRAKMRTGSLLTLYAAGFSVVSLLMLRDGRITVADFVMLFGFLLTSIETVWRLSMDSFAALESVNNIHYVTNEFQRNLQKPRAKVAAKERARGTYSVHGHIDRGGTRVLENICLDIPVGSSVLVVGESGSGKTSLLDSLGRVLSGLGTSDDDDLEVLCPRERDGGELPVSYVPQVAPLFRRSLSANMLYEGRSESLLPYMIERAGLTKTVSKHRYGLGTILDAAGSNFSRGESHRIYLSRVFGGASEIVILDEPTAALDSANSRTVLENVLKHAKGKTVLVSSHDRTLEDLFDMTVVVRDRTVSTFKPIRQATQHA